MGMSEIPPSEYCDCACPGESHTILLKRIIDLSCDCLCVVYHWMCNLCPCEYTFIRRVDTCRECGDNNET